MALTALAIVFAAACSEGDSAATADASAGVERVVVPATPSTEGDRYGADITLDAITPVSAILADPSAYVGRSVLVEGRVEEVCEQRGCWMDIVAEDGVEIQVKVEDDVIVFPASARGRTALVEGVVEERVLSPEQTFAAAAHRAQEQGVPFDSSATYPATTTYRIQGAGALIRG